jgi:hypothetical protein
MQPLFSDLLSRTRIALLRKMRTRIALLRKMRTRIALLRKMRTRIALLRKMRLERCREPSSFETPFETAPQDEVCGMRIALLRKMRLERCREPSSFETPFETAPQDEVCGTRIALLRKMPRLTLILRSGCKPRLEGRGHFASFEMSPIDPYLAQKRDAMSFPRDHGRKAWL